MTTKTSIHSKPLLILFLVISMAVHAFAQTKPYNEEITVVAPFDPIIPDAFKINRNPSLDDTLTAIPSLTYSIVPRIADVKPVIEQMPAVKLIAEPLSKLYRNYIRAGAGNYSSLYGELFISTLRSKQFAASIRLKHLSSGGKIADYGPPARSRDEAAIDINKYFSQHTLSGRVYFNRDGLHLYGYKPTEWNFPIEKHDIRQRYYTVGTKAGFASTYKSDERLNHTFGLSYYHMAGLDKTAENNVNLSAALTKRYDLLKIGPDQLLGAKAEVEFLNQRNESGHINSAIVTLSPTMKADINEYSFEGGLKLSVSRDTATHAYLYPVLEARIELIPNALKLFAGLNGSLERTSLKSITSQNLFISSIIPWNYINDKFKAYGGFQSNISRVFNLNGSIASHTFENYPFFVTDTNSLCNNSFTLLYDDLTCVIVKGELEFVKSTKLRLGLSGIYNHYKLAQEPHAWHKPAWQFEFTGRYDIGNKIIANLKAMLNGPVWALAPELGAGSGMEESYFIYDARKIKGWADVSLGTEYRFNNAFSVWLNINNLANSTYFRWYNYRSYGLNVLGGISYSF